jgi:hypothetical protein
LVGQQGRVGGDRYNDRTARRLLGPRPA